MSLPAFDLVDYRPADALYLWWLARPEQPVLVGTLETVRASRGVSLRYAPSWLQSGFALSEDLPLRDVEFLPTGKDTAAGAVDDARPDRWGERVIRVLDKPPRLSLLDYLFYAGDERFGALGARARGAATRYRPMSRCGRRALTPATRNWRSCCAAGAWCRAESARRSSANCSGAWCSTS